MHTSDEPGGGGTSGTSGAKPSPVRRIYRVHPAGGGVYYIFEKKDGRSSIYGMTAGTGARERAERIAEDANAREDAA